jgi:arylsulfatase A-like enzyme
LIRIPLLLRVPWLPKQSPEIDEMASLVDLLPTILDLLEIDPYGLTMQGRSLLPVIPDNKAFAASRFFFAEAMQGKFPNQPEIFRWSTMITQKHLKMHRWQLQKNMPPGCCSI